MNRGEDPEASGEPPRGELRAPFPKDGRPALAREGRHPIGGAQPDHRRGDKGGKEPEATQRRPKPVVAFDGVNACDAENWPNGEREPAVAPVQPGRQHQAPNIDRKKSQDKQQSEVLHASMRWIRITIV